MNPTILNFLKETLQRVFEKSPTFFKWWQRIFGTLTLLSGIPYALDQFNINLPEPIATFANKAIMAFSAGAWFMAQFPVKTVPVAQTTEGEAVTVLDKSKMPFTVKSEAKDVQQSEPPPPVVPEIESPTDK